MYNENLKTFELEKKVVKLSSFLVCKALLETEIYIFLVTAYCLNLLQKIRKFAIFGVSVKSGK